MKGLIKLTAVLSGIIIVLIAATFILLKTLVTPERIKQTVLPVAEKSLHRTVTLDDVSINIFSGINLTGLTIMNSAGNQPFVSCSGVKLHYALMPLLQGRVEIGEISLIKPEIHVIRNSDGSFNFSDILKQPGPEKGVTKEKAVDASTDRGNQASEQAHTEKKPKNDAAASADSSLSIMVSSISISDGRIIFTDMAAPGKKTVETVLSDVDMKISNFSMDAPFPVRFSAMLNQGSIEADGNVGIKGPAVDMSIRVKGLGIPGFSPYFAANLPGELKNALIGSDINLRFNPNALDASGAITVADIQFIPEANPEAAIKNASASLDFNAVLKEKNTTLILQNTVLNLNGVKINAEGSVTSLSSTPVVDMLITVPAQKIAAIMAALPDAYAGKARALEPSGAISARASLKGKADRGAKLVQSASLDLEKISINSDGIPITVNGGLHLQGNSVKSRNLVINLKDSVIKTDLRADNIFGKIINVKTAMNADTVDLDAVLADKKADTGQAPSENRAAAGKSADNGSPATGGKKGGAAPSEPDAVNIPVNAAGTISVALLKYHNIPVRDVRLNYTFKNNRLRVQQVADVAGGEIKKNVNLDLGVKGYRYEGDFDVSHALAQDILAYAAPSFRDMVKGILDLKGNFKGQGIKSEDIKRNLYLKGNWNILEGQLAKAGIVSKLASFLNLEKELQTIDFKNAYGDFLVEAGKIIFKSKFSSDRINLAPEGSVSLDGNLDIHLNAVLSPELAAKIPAGKLLSPMRDSRGWSVLPLMVKGTWSAPAITLDTTAVKNQAIHSLTNSLFGKEKKQEETGTTEKGTEGKTEETPQKPAEQLLEHTIKGLFGN